MTANGMEAWVIYDRETGEDRFCGAGVLGTASAQTIPEGLALAVVPMAAVAGTAINLDVVRAAIVVRINAEAEAVRMLHLTPGFGQAKVYDAQEREARGLLAGGTEPTPFLSAKAAAEGKTVAEVAAEVTAAADRWLIIGPAIEGVRAATRTRIMAATTFGHIVDASFPDWPTLSDGGVAASP